MRHIRTGRGASATALSPAAIAVKRSHLIDSRAERILFMDTFNRISRVAKQLVVLSPLDLDTACDMTRRSSVMEAAMIEALASLRAEGLRL